MNDNNMKDNLNNNPAPEKPVAPPLVPKSEAKKPEVKEKVAPVVTDKKDVGKNKKFLYILIPVIAIILVAAIIIAVALKKDKTEKTDPTTTKVIVATDENGVAITDVNGVPVTIVPETEVVNVTDVNGVPVTDNKGNNVTTVVYKDVDVTVNVAVTNENGEEVTNSKGEVVTQQVVVPQDPNQAGSGNVVLGTTAVAITDGQGNTAVDNEGNLYQLQYYPDRR